MKPKLRFKNFNNDWITCTIKDVADVVGGGTPDTSNSEFWNGSINWFTPSEIGNSKYISNSERKITELGIQKSSAKLLPIGTILLSSRATVGEASILVNNQACTNQGFQSLIAHENINNEFLYYLKDKYKKNMLNKAFGSTFLEISRSNIEKIKINIPTIEEQIKISNFLSLLDKKIELQSKKIEDLKLFTKKVIKDTLNCEKNIESSFLKDVCTIQTGKSNTQDKDENGKNPFYIRSESIEHSSKYIFDCEAVITIGDGNIGKVFFYENGKFDCHQRVYVLNNFKKVTGKYLYYYFSTFFYKRAMSMSAKNTVDSVRMEMISDMEIIYPNIDEQKRITDVFDKLEKKQKLEVQKLEKFVNLKKGLIQSMFV